MADAVIPEPAFTAIREPADDELRETGLVTGVEDNGYPLFTVTIEFRAGQPGFPLSANAAALNLGVTLDSLTGKTITVESADGGKIAFDLYVTDEMVAANGKTVTAIYGMRPYNRITLLAP